MLLRASSVILIYAVTLSWYRHIYLPFHHRQTPPSSSHARRNSASTSVSFPVLIVGGIPSRFICPKHARSCFLLVHFFSPFFRLFLLLSVPPFLAQRYKVQNTRHTSTGPSCSIYRYRTGELTLATRLECKEHGSCVTSATYSVPSLKYGLTSDFQN